MAVTVDELLLKITLGNEKTAKELENIKDELKDLQKEAKKTSDGVSGFSASFAKFSVIALAATKGIEILINSISGITSEFTQSEDAVKKLSQALEIAGNKSIKVAIDQFSELADKIESFGVASREQILNLAKIGTAAGQTTAQTQKLVQVAADLSVARDIPLETAFRSLSATLKGSSGQLANFIPELANLTEEQNKAGMAIDYVSLQLGGFASKNLETYAGSIAVLKSRFSDVIEEIGHIVVDIIGLDSQVKKSTSSFETISKSLAQNRESIVAFGKAVLDVFGYIADAVANTAISMVGAFGIIEQGVGKLVTGFGWLNVGFEKVTGLTTGLGESLVQTGKEMSAAGSSYHYAANEMLKATDPIKETAVVLGNVTGKAEEAAAALAKIREQILTKDQLAAWDALKTKIIELQKVEVESGKVGADLIRSKEKAALNEIASLEKRLSLGRTLTDVQKAAISAAQAAIKGSANADIGKLYKDTLDEIQAKNREIETATKSFNASQRDQIKFELDSKLEALDLARKKIDLEDKASLNALDHQKDLLKQQAAKKSENAPSANFEGLKKVGVDVAAKISGVFTNGALDMIGGAVSMVGLVVEAINGLLDFIPNFINSLAGIFNKLTDFPEVLFNAFQGLFDGVIRFVSDFIPKLLESIPKSMMQITNFIHGFIDAVKGLFQQLPGMIKQLVNELPALLTDLISATVSALPELWAAIIDFIIRDFPGIFMNIMKAVYIKIPIAIVNGIIGGLVKIAKTIQALFTGKKLKIDAPKIDTKGIENSLSKLSENSSRLFNVQDLLAAAKNPLAKVKEDIQAAFNKGRNYVMEAWNWVLEKVLKPLWDLITKAWRWVWDNVLGPLVDLITKAWQWVVDNVLTPIAAVVEKAFQWVIDGLSAVWEVFKQIGQAVVDSFAAVWEVFKVISKFIVDSYAAAWEVFKQIGQFIADLFSASWEIFKQIGQAVGQLFSASFEVLKQVGKFIAEAFSASWEVFKKISQVIIDAYSALWEVFKKVGQSIIEAFSAIWDSLKDVVKTAFNFVVDIWDQLKNIVSTAFKFVTDLWDALVNVVEAAFKSPKALWEALKNVVEIAFKFVKDIWDGLATIVSTAFQFLADIWTNLSTTVAAAFKPIVDLWNGLKDVVSGAFKSILDFKFSWPDLPKFSWPDISFKWPAMPAFPKFTWPALPKFTWPELPELKVNVPGVSGGGGGGGTIGAISKEVSSWFARGGPVYAAGGFFAPKGSDTVPAMLTPGEFVMSRPAVQAIGLDNLRAMNKGVSPGGGSSTYNISFEINVDAKTPMDEGYIRGTLIPKMSEELKRASLDGKFVISSRGIR